MNKIELLKKINSNQLSLEERYKVLLAFVKNMGDYDREIYKLFIRAERDIKKIEKQLKMKEEN